jgi:integrase
MAPMLASKLLTTRFATSDRWLERGGASIVREGPAPRLSERAREAMRLRHFSARTEEAYLGWMRRYHEFHGRRDPAALGPQHVTAFLNALATHGHVAASTQNQGLAALLFLYRDVLGIQLPWLDDLVHAKTPARLPVVLTRDEVRAVLGHMEGGPRDDAARVHQG